MSVDLLTRLDEIANSIDSLRNELQDLTKPGSRSRPSTVIGSVDLQGPVSSQFPVSARIHSLLVKTLMKVD